MNIQIIHTLKQTYNYAVILSPLSSVLMTFE